MSHPSFASSRLATSMGQCCGGVVDILFESFANGLPAWLRDLRALHGQREGAALVTDLSGEMGKYVVTANNVFGDSEVPANIESIAREGLESNRRAHRIDDWFFEDIVGTEFNIAVFGAGHVGSAVVRSLSDARLATFAGSTVDAMYFATRHRMCGRIESADPALEGCGNAGKQLFPRHDAQSRIDFDICDRILRRGDAGVYCGLIGSAVETAPLRKTVPLAGHVKSDMLERPDLPDRCRRHHWQEAGRDCRRCVRPRCCAPTSGRYEIAEPVYPDNVHPLQRGR